MNVYQVPRRRKRGAFWLILLLCSACAVCFGIGFAAVKTMHAPPKDVTDYTPMPQPTTSLSDTGALTEDAGPVASSTTVPRDMSEEKTEEYLVKSEDDEVHVFRILTDGSTKFSQKLPVVLSDLPVSDRKKLEEGIYISDKTSLLELIEDYCS